MAQLIRLNANPTTTFPEAASILGSVVCRHLGLIRTWWTSSIRGSALSNDVCRQFYNAIQRWRQYEGAQKKNRNYPFPAIKAGHLTGPTRYRTQGPHSDDTDSG